METILRLEAGDDLTALVPLSRSFFEEYAAHHPTFFAIGELKDSHITDYFVRSTSSDGNATFVARSDDHIVGYITVHVRRQADFYKVNRIGTISGLMVHKDHRRKGTATRLLAEARRFFREAGVAYLTVYTAAANEDALRFYERSGMSPLHVAMVGETGVAP